MIPRAAGATSRILISLLLTSCASTVVRSGLPPGRTAANFDERWHAAFLFGAVPATRRYDLAAICPQGWSEIRLAPDEFTFAASAVTAFLYSPSRLTIVCAAEDPSSPPRLGAYPPPRRGNGTPDPPAE